MAGLNEKQRKFCREYIREWNALRSYMVAYPKIKSYNAAGVQANKILKNPHVQAYIAEIQKNLEEVAQVSRLKVINEHLKIAFSSIAHLHNTWIERKDFESLTDDQKACIAEIDTKIKTEYEFDPENPKEKKAIKVEYIRVKLYDKQKSLDSISRMLGYDAPTKIAAALSFTDIPEVIIKARE